MKIKIPNPIYWLYYFFNNVILTKINAYKNTNTLKIQKRQIKKQFKKLNWDNEEVFKITSHVPSLVDATRVLTLKLLEHSDVDVENKDLYNYAKKLVHSGFNRSWS